jgi:predicted dehydrogenase
MSEQPRRTFLRAVSAGAIAPGLAVAAQPARNRIKIGQIGVGHAHATKLSVYRQSPNYEVVGIVEPDAALRKRAETQAAFRDLPWLTQERLLNTPGLQAVLVETRVGDLLRTAETCVNAGKHVHIDKPAGESLPHLRRILTAVGKQKLLVQMGYMFRYNPAIVMLRDFLRQGWLGEVFEVHAVMSKVVAAEERRRLAEFRGGMMFELGCHILDLVINVLGRPRDVTGIAHHSARLDDKLMDNMLCVLNYPRASATLRASALEVDGGQRRHLVVCGSEGTFHIQPLDNPSARVALSRPRGAYKSGYQDIRFPRYVRYVDDAADMARIIRGEKASDFSAEHDLTVQETLLRACSLPLT